MEANQEKVPGTAILCERDNGVDFDIMTKDGRYHIAAVFGGIPGCDPRATAERMTAAWNACEGTPTEWLKAWRNPVIESGRVALGKPTSISGAFQSMLARAVSRTKAGAQ